MKERSSEDIVYPILAVGAGIFGIIFLPNTLFWLHVWKNDIKIRIKWKLVFKVTFVFACLCVFWLGFLDRYPLYYLDIFYSVERSKTLNWLLVGGRVIWIWSLIGTLSPLFVPLVLSFKKPTLGIRTKHFKRKNSDFSEMKSTFAVPTTVPLGQDVRDQSVISISEYDRTAHSLIIGATGAGKTTLMVNMILHAIKHGHACVIIDPKGEDSTLAEIVRYGRRLCTKFDSRFHLFSISKPKKSYQYNPLKHGNANELKDRIMEALVWSEQYYQNIAGEFLTAFTACTEYLGIVLSLERVSRVLSFKDEQAEILKALKKKFNDGDAQALDLYNLLQSFFAKTKESDLSGLIAQIAILNNPTFGKLLSFHSSENEIDLRHIRKNGGIAYFQLNTLANGDSARRLGRMIVEDLKSVASEVFNNEAESERLFFPIFIDEFGSFATKEFIEFLKQTRGAKFGNHLFCQGLEDLDVVTPQFRRQVMTNTKTKIALRVDDHETVNEFCAAAGTFDALEQSYQVSGEMMAQKTGMGNMRETKQMQIEHDVLKQLCIGEAVVVQKSPLRVSGIEICPIPKLVDKPDFKCLNLKDIFKFKISLKQPV